MKLCDGEDFMLHWKWVSVSVKTTDEGIMLFVIDVFRIK